MTLTAAPSAGGGAPNVMDRRTRENKEQGTIQVFGRRVDYVESQRLRTES